MTDNDNVSGVLQLNEKGFGFLRQASNDYQPRPKDTFVPRSLIEKMSLKEGLFLEGRARPPQDSRGNLSPQLDQIDSINMAPVAEYRKAPEFTELVSVDPTERLELSAGNDKMSMR